MYTDNSKEDGYESVKYFFQSLPNILQCLDKTHVNNVS